MAKWKEHEKEKKGAKVFCEKVKSTVQHNRGNVRVKGREQTFSPGLSTDPQYPSSPS